MKHKNNDVGAVMWGLPGEREMAEFRVEIRELCEAHANPLATYRDVVAGLRSSLRDEQLAAGQSPSLPPRVLRAGELRLTD